jgi:SAM-dependent methyltransferase
MKKILRGVMKMRNLPWRIFSKIKSKIFPGSLGAPIYKVWNRGKQQFVCAICNYHGPFYDAYTEKNEHCPKCGSNVRIRLQYLVIDELCKTCPLSDMSILHFAPERVLQPRFRKIFRYYASADISGQGVTYQADLLALPFADQSYDFVYASHVLEHIMDDQKALSEIRRILKPGGIAVLPVPIVSHKTIEYPEPNPEEYDHVRAPGTDYFERYAAIFSKVDIYRSSDFAEKYQLYSYEDRTSWPSEKMPLRQAMSGYKHLDYVPVCFV